MFPIIIRFPHSVECDSFMRGWHPTFLFSEN